MKKTDLQTNQIDGEAANDEFIELAREHYFNDFPNPDRYGCPSAADLLKIARSPDLPPDSVHQHFLMCSPCLKDFRAARAVQVISPAVEPKVSWFTFFRQPAIISAAMFFLISGLVGTTIYLWSARSNSETFNRRLEPVLTEQQPAVIEDEPANQRPPKPEKTDADKISGDSTKPIPPEISKKKTENSKPNRAVEERLTPENTFYLDLAKAAVVRGESVKERLYKLPAKTINLNITLPENSPAGKYDISLLDEFHQPLIAGKIIVSGGKSISFNLNLQNRRGRARLCIAPKNEIPDCFPIEIGNDQ